MSKQEVTPMRVKIIANKIIANDDLVKLEQEVNEFLETENLDTYNVIDNVVNDCLSFTILHRIRENMPEEELKEVVEAKVEAAKNAQAE